MNIGRDRAAGVRVSDRVRAVRGAVAVFGAVALALATPRCAAAEEADTELRHVTGPPVAEAGPELELHYRPGAAETGPEPQLLYPPPAAENDPALGPRHGERALVEFATVLLAENIRYWVEAGFVEDWQYELTWEDQKKRLLQLDGVRFDSNGFQTNWTHAYAGAIFYSIGRINNLGVGESFLLSIFSSLYWEAVVEWKEVFSVNDAIVTDLGALSIGEPWYQLSRYLLTRQDPVARVLGFIHPLMGLHSVFDPASLPRPTDSQTLPGYGVYFTLGTAIADSPYRSDTGTFLNLGLRSRLALAPGYTAPGAESRQGWEVLSSNFTINADLDGGTAQEFDVSSGAVFYGWLERSVAADSRGSASILGLGSAFTLFRKAPVTDYDAGRVRVGLDNLHLEEPRDHRDKYAIMHLFGPVYEGFWRGSGAVVSWGLEAYPDFALVNAYALNAYSVGHEIAGSKTTLLYSGYYYGYGGSAMARFAVGAGPVTFGAAASLHYHESIDSLDRYESELTADVHATDTWARIDVNFGVAIPGTPFIVDTSARWMSRRGTVGETVAEGSESRYSLGITWRL